MAKRPVKKATAKKTVTAKRDVPSLRPEWPKCSWCDKPSVYKFTRQDKVLFCCIDHNDKMKLNRGTSPSAKKKVLAPAKNPGLKKMVKRAKKAGDS